MMLWDEDPANQSTQTMDKRPTNSLKKGKVRCAVYQIYTRTRFHAQQRASNLQSSQEKCVYTSRIAIMQENPAVMCTMQENVIKTT